MTERPTQYRAEGTCDVGTYKSGPRFAAFLAEGDSETRAGVLREFGLGVVAQVQGRIITFERVVRDPRQVTPGRVWLKCTEPVAQRVHVVSVYAIGWPS